MLLSSNNIIIIIAYNLRACLIGSGDIDINVSLSNLTTANITSGGFGVDRIPDMSAKKITADTLDTSRIPDISAAKIIASRHAGCSTHPRYFRD
jgi:hypothetical protein